jgi:hypothetical protein
MSLKDTLSAYRVRIQGELLPWIEDTLCGPLSGHHKQLASVLGMARIEMFLPAGTGFQAARHLNARRWHAPSWQRRCSTFQPPVC